MTKIRFHKKTIDNWESYIVDIETGKEYGSKIDPLLELLNTLSTEKNELEKENKHIKNTIQWMLENERTELGKNVLKQLQEAITND